MIQLFLHLLGDYFLQNDWMAQNKNKFNAIGWKACSIHCVYYSTPFLIYYESYLAYMLILVSHFLIDKFSLAKYVTMLINWNWEGTNFGFDDTRPPYISTWIHIIRDNTMHLFCNFLIIKYCL